MTCSQITKSQNTKQYCNKFSEDLKKKNGPHQKTFTKPRGSLGCPLSLILFSLIVKFPKVTGSFLSFDPRSIIEKKNGRLLFFLKDNRTVYTVEIEKRWDNNFKQSSINPSWTLPLEQFLNQL